MGRKVWSLRCSRVLWPFDCRLFCWQFFKICAKRTKERRK